MAEAAGKQTLWAGRSGDAMAQQVGWQWLEPLHNKPQVITALKSKELPIKLFNIRIELDFVDDDDQFVGHPSLAQSCSAGKGGVGTSQCTGPQEAHVFGLYITSWKPWEAW